MTRANAGLSSDKPSEKLGRRKPKGSWVKLIFPVTIPESAPKARQKCVVDGKQVNIPVPLLDAMGGRRRLARPSVGIGGLSV